MVDDRQWTADDFFPSSAIFHLSSSLHFPIANLDEFLLHISKHVVELIAALLFSGEKYSYQPLFFFLPIKKSRLVLVGVVRVTDLTNQKHRMDLFYCRCTHFRVQLLFQYFR